MIKLNLLDVIVLCIELEKCLIFWFKILIFLCSDGVFFFRMWFFLRGVNVVCFNLFFFLSFFIRFLFFMVNFCVEYVLRYFFGGLVEIMIFFFSDFGEGNFINVLVVGG